MDNTEFIIHVKNIEFKSYSKHLVEKIKETLQNKGLLNLTITYPVKAYLSTLREKTFLTLSGTIFLLLLILSHDTEIQNIFLIFLAIAFLIYAAKSHEYTTNIHFNRALEPIGITHYQETYLQKKFIKNIKLSDLITKTDYVEPLFLIEGQYQGKAYKALHINCDRFYKLRLGDKSQKNDRIVGGYFIQFKLNKTYKGKTIVLADRKKIGNYINLKSTGLKRAHLVSPEFEKNFEVFTSDQVEARYIIDHLMIETLLNILNQSSINYFTFSIWGNNLAFMVSFQNEENNTKISNLIKSTQTSRQKQYAFGDKQITFSNPHHEKDELLEKALKIKLDLEKLFSLRALIKID